MLSYQSGCLIGLLSRMILYGALVVSAQSGRHDAVD